MSMARYVFTVSAYKDARGYGTADTGVRTMRSRELMPKNEAAIKSFLGMSGITSKTAIFPAYYGELLAWALIRKGTLANRRNPWISLFRAGICKCQYGLP